MKILHTADWHLGKRLNDYLRIEEQRVVLNEICEIAEQEAVDAVVIAGDLYDTFNPGNDATELFYKTIHRLANNGERAVIAIAGNHDSPDRIDAPVPLANECGIILYGNSDTVVNTFELKSGLKVTNAEPGFVELKLPKSDSPLRLLLTPYANEITLKRYLGKEDKENELRTLLAESWKDLAERYCDDKGINMLVAHLYFMRENGEPPEEPEDEKSILHLGGAQAIYTNLIPEQIQYTALGHLHRYQTIDKTTCPVVYSSSPLAYSFSEADQQKYVIVIDANPGKPVELKAVSLKNGRKLKRKRFELLEEATEWLLQNPDTYVELTLVSDTFIDSKTKKALYEVHDGIVSIIPEIKSELFGGNGQQKIDLNQDIRSLFADYFLKKRGQEPNEDLIRLFNEILDTSEE